MILATFLLSLIAMVFVGIASAAKSTGSRTDYYLASRNVSPMLVGLSAVATNNSGYMFIGVIGFTYTTGVSAFWLMFGWIVGDFLASLFIHRRVRVQAELRREVTFAGMLSRWDGADFKAMRRIAAGFTVIFLGAYAAAQLGAGGKALQAVFGWQMGTGAIMVAGVVAIYCLAGGIRASIWTDAVQSVVMMIAMSVLVVAAMLALGGFGAIMQAFSQIPGYLDPFPGDLLVPGIMGPVLFVVGWLFAGLSVVGQPHIMVRFMALDNPDHLARARWWYYSFFTLFYALATAVGLMSRLLLPDLAQLDTELALPTMALELLPAPLVGLVLAGIFAATMSTADSLILSCSASLTHDIAARPTESKWMIKGATLLVTLFALGIALFQPASVFSLVILSWSVLASAFAPLLIVYALGGGVSQRTALAMMLTGPAVAVLWRALGWQNSIYEGLPGILAGLAVYGVLVRVRRQETTAAPPPDDAGDIAAPAAAQLPER